MVVSETFAHTFFDARAVGRRFRWAGSPAKDPGVEIIGIVSDIKYRSVRAPSPALVYIPVMQDPARTTLHVRSTLPASAILTRVRQEIRGLDPGVAPFNVRTLDRQVDESLATERGLSFLASALGLVTLALTSVGLAASIAQMITRRTREIGIRLALGALVLKWCAGASCLKGYCPRRSAEPWECCSPILRRIRSPGCCSACRSAIRWFSAGAWLS